MTRNTRARAVLCSALLGLTLISCVGGARPKSPEPSPLSPSPSPSNRPKTKILRTPLLIKETRYVGKDSLDSYTVYQYSSDYLVMLNKQVFDAQRAAAVSKTTYEYANGLLASETSSSGSEKNSTSRISYGYDASGRRIEEKRQDDSGNVLVTSRYEFDADGKKKSWKIYLAGNLLVAETLYEYVKGDLARIVMKNGKNEYLSAIDITRDKKGRELTRINKTIRNITESFEEYGYEGDRLAWEKKTGPSGKLLLSVFYEYKGTSGLLEKKTIKAPDGKIKEYYLYEYAYKEEEVPIE